MFSIVDWWQHGKCEDNYEMCFATVDRMSCGDWAVVVATGGVCVVAKPNQDGLLSFPFYVVGGMETRALQNKTTTYM